MKGHTLGLYSVWPIALGFLLLEAGNAQASVALASGQIEYRMFFAFDTRANFALAGPDG